MTEDQILLLNTALKIYEIKNSKEKPPRGRGDIQESFNEAKDLIDRCKRGH